MTKFDRLTAVLDDFHRQLETEQHEFIVRLRQGWASAKRDYAKALQARAVTRSVIASGIEQGIRETPMLLQALPEHVRVFASQALSSALQRHAPDLHAKDLERLNKIVAKGKIKGESEYHLVRHHIDTLEGTAEGSALLSTLYALEDAFQSQ
jgi:predicted urease superfamily metal-dependent hydrolase